MKKILLLLIFFSGIRYATAQCEFGLEYEQEELNRSNQITDNTQDELPADFLMTANQIKMFFGVNAAFRLYNEPNNSSARALCKCSNDPSCENVVFVGRKLMDLYRYQFNKDGLWGILAHELGHTLQCRWGTHTALNGVQRELHADFLAGYFLGIKMRIQLTDIRQFSEELFSRGDYNFNDEQHHGTPQERVQYMLMGASLSMLTLQDAYNYCINYLRGLVGYFNINGIWNSRNSSASPTPVVLNAFTYGNQFYFQALNAYNRLPVGPQIAALQVGPNQYRVVWPSGSPFMANIVQDFIVINNGLIVVMQSDGTVDVLWR